MNESSPIWLFDSVCVLCETSVRFTIRHEIAPNIRFVSIQSVRGREIANENGIDPDDPESFLFIENGETHAKSDGVIALANHLKYPARMIKFGWVVPKFIRDRAYDIIALNRYKLFGRRNECIIPDELMRHRFVLQGK